MADEHPATTGHGRSPADACSVLWDADGTSAYGTAAVARFFVVVEQPGPWGRQAATESHLDPDLGAELDRRCSSLGGRFMLIRRPGAHADRTAPPDRHRVLLAHSGARPGDAWLLQGDVAAVGELLGIDWSALARGHRDVTAASLSGAAAAPPALLVCTNGRRDVCCAVRGRPLAATGWDRAPGRVWEVSHTGGHRFAPTAVLLPWGQTYSRLDDDAVEWVLAASRTAHTPRELLGSLHDRGRAALTPPAQAAESFVRASIGETHLPALWAHAPEPASEAGPAAGSAAGSEAAPATVVVVEHEDGRTWRTRVRRSSAGLDRPESCGKSAVPVHHYDVTL